MQAANYESQAAPAAALIGQLKTEKEALVKKAEMGIRRIQMIIASQRERLHKKLKDNVATIWEWWTKQTTKLQLLRADVENRKKSGDFFYKMDQESIITIQEELADDFEAMDQEQTEGIRRLLAKFKDDQLEMTLQLEA